MEKICAKCQKEITDNSTYCQSCGGLVVDKEGHRVKSIQRKKIIGIIGAITVALIVALVIFFLIPFPYNATEHYKIQEPYTDVENYFEKEPYQGTEPYIEQVSATNCNSDRQCTCISYAYWGLGPCDTCSCQRSRSITLYHDVPKTRTVTKYRTVQQEREVTKTDSLINMIMGITTHDYYL